MTPNVFGWTLNLTQLATCTVYRKRWTSNSKARKMQMTLI